MDRAQTSIIYRIIYDKSRPSLQVIVFRQMYDPIDWLNIRAVSFNFLDFSASNHTSFYARN